MRRHLGILIAASGLAASQATPSAARFSCDEAFSRVADWICADLDRSGRDNLVELYSLSESEPEERLAINKREQVRTTRFLLNSSDVCQLQKQEFGSTQPYAKFAPVDADVDIGVPLVDPDASSALGLEFGVPMVYDFDNDGYLDAVYVGSHASNYQNDRLILVERGSSRKTLRIASNPLPSSRAWLLPCQGQGPTRMPLAQCPGFPQGNEEAGIRVQFATGSVFFGARYTHLLPFRYQGRTYVHVSTVSEETSRFTAVVEPSPRGRLRPVCLLEDVTQNFSIRRLSQQSNRWQRETQDAS
jgi:hypothetical protein